MYYHPFMFEWASGQRTMATYQACVGVWLDGVARQQQAHADAVNAFCTRQLTGLRAISEARDAAQLAAGLLSCAAPKPLDFAELSAQLGGIVVETHRRLGDLIGAHTGQITRSLVEPAEAAGEPRQKAANGGRAAFRRQMVA